MGLAPVRFSDFRVTSTLGTGATARVLGAVRIATGEPVALKILEDSRGGSAELRERFAREAVLLGELSSRYVARLLGFGFDRGRPFLVLERLEGRTAAEHLEEHGRVALDRATAWGEALLLGLRDCHDAGIIHRDVKPANLFIALAPRGHERPVLIDFGIARLRDTLSVGSGITRTNHVLGSVGYMAPEQLRRPREVGPEADLYAAGAVLYRVITGELPFLGASLQEVARRKESEDPPRASSVAGAPASPALDAFLARAMAREPKLRFASAREMLSAMRAALEEADSALPDSYRR